MVVIETWKKNKLIENKIKKKCYVGKLNLKKSTVLMLKKVYIELYLKQKT